MFFWCGFHHHLETKSWLILGPVRNLVHVHITLPIHNLEAVQSVPCAARQSLQLFALSVDKYCVNCGQWPCLETCTF